MGVNIGDEHVFCDNKGDIKANRVPDLEHVCGWQTTPMTAFIPSDMKM